MHSIKTLFSICRIVSLVLSALSVCVDCCTASQSLPSARHAPTQINISVWNTHYVKYVSMLYELSLIFVLRGTLKERKHPPKTNEPSGK